jgi:hypothetical protein
MPFGMIALYAAMADPIIFTFGWFWLARSPVNTPRWRHHAITGGMILASMAAAMQLLFTIAVALEAYRVDIILPCLELMGLFAIAGIIAGMFGEGRRRTIVVLCSAFMLVVCMLTFMTAGH